MGPNVGWVHIDHRNFSRFIEFGLFLPKKFTSKESFEKKNQRLVVSYKIVTEEREKGLQRTIFSLV